MQQHQISICLVCINYGSDLKCMAYINSMQQAIRAYPELKLRLVVVDNTPREDSDAFFGSIHDLYPEALCVKSENNTGYFGGVRFGLAHFNIAPTNFDYLAVTNVDLLFDPTFFVELAKLHQTLPANTGAIGPAILNLPGQWDSNPHFHVRPASSLMWFYKFIFSNMFTLTIYTFLWFTRDCLRKYIKLPTKHTNSDPIVQVYSIHGAFMLLTRNYFQRGGDFDYPIHLFGEEIFIAETLRQKRLIAVHTRDLKIFHKAHDSTGMIPGKKHSIYVTASSAHIYDAYFHHSSKVSQG